MDGTPTVSSTTLATTGMEHRLARLLLIGESFTADDVTADGAVTIDGQHTPNGTQNGVGALFNRLARRRIIEWTGTVVRSNAPHRKGGAIRVWRATEAGRLWARSTLAAAVDSRP